MEPDISPTSLASNSVLVKRKLARVRESDDDSHRERTIQSGCLTYTSSLNGTPIRCDLIDWRVRTSHCGARFRHAPEPLAVCSTIKRNILISLSKVHLTTNRHVYMPNGLVPEMGRRERVWLNELSISTL